MSEFKKLNNEGNSYFWTDKLRFSPIGSFKPQTVERVFEFAYDMTFGGNGEHRNHRTGGTHRRRKGEIFANAFQGKLAECAVYNQLYRIAEISEPDFEVYGLGEWDSADFLINGQKVSIKSTKSFGQLLLLETKDWNENGVYLPNNEAYSFTFLVRMNPYCEEIMKNNRILYSDTADCETLRDIICKETWEYDIPGFITLDELKYVIRNDYIIPQGAYLNGKTPMDAENYYIQAGNMHSLSEFEEIV